MYTLCSIFVLDYCWDRRSWTK